MSDRVVAGGRAHLTGAKWKGPQGPDFPKADLATKEGPADGWYAFDCTPKDADDKDFGPMPTSERSKAAEEQVNPEFEGVPTFDGDPNTQALRLTFDYEGDGSADLVHEYANHGCTPRIKTRGAHGTISNLKFLAADGVEIKVDPPSFKVGAEKGSKPKASDGSSRLSGPGGAAGG